MFNGIQVRSVVLTALAVVIAGCGGGPSAIVREHYVEFSPHDQETIQAHSSLPYRFQGGDIFDVAFSYLKDLDQHEVLVLPDGSVNLIGVERLMLAGLTLAEADDLITKAYARDYRDPELTLILRKTKGR